MMKVTIRLGNCNRIDASIAVQQKAVDRKPLSAYDTTILTDTKSILVGIREYLKGGLNED